MTASASSPAIAVVSSQAGEPADDQLLVSELQARGAAARIVAWDEAEVAWSGFSAAVVRSTWDYHLRPGEFLRWVETTGRATRLFNPPHVLAWNAHKSYLADLQRAGVPVVPTWRGDLADGPALDRLLAAHDWTEAVVKPAISASAHGTYRVVRGASLNPGLVAALPARDVLVQPYLREIETRGEFSLVVLAGRLSHALRKVPRRGDFRSQAEFGGTAEVVAAPAGAGDLARAALRAAPGPALYARVDLLPGDNGTWLLGELELIEPWLHLEAEERAAERFAAALLGALGCFPRS